MLLFYITLVIPYLWASESASVRSTLYPDVPRHNLIRSQRLQEVKIDILSKLNMRAPPSVPGVQPPINYSPASRIIPAHSWRPCGMESQRLLCIQFDYNVLNIDDEAWQLSVWKSKRHDPTGKRQTFVLNQVISSSTNGSLAELSTLQVDTSFEGWISFNISLQKSEAANSKFLDLFIREDNTTGASLDMSRQPFIKSKSFRKRRAKRAIDWCTPERRNCCRESLEVSFQELGWDRWIVEPRGFTMFYCAGKCNRVSREDIRQAGNTYLGLLLEISPPQRLLMDNERRMPKAVKDGLTPCCTAKTKQPLSVLLIENGNYTNVKLAMLPDMIVKECGCVG